MYLDVIHFLKYIGCKGGNMSIYLFGTHYYHRDSSIHLERECLAVFSFAKLGCFVRLICLFFYYFFTTQILGAVAADLIYKSVPGLCLIISRAARFLLKLALNNILSLCVYYNLYVYFPLSSGKTVSSFLVHRYVGRYVRR